MLTKGFSAMKSLAVAVALAVLLSGAPAFAQAPTQPPPAQPAPTQPAKPAPTTPAPAAPAQATPPKPFPEGSKIAFVVLQRIVNESAEGKAASTRIQGLQQKRAAELTEKNKQLQG